MKKVVGLLTVVCTLLLLACDKTDSESSGLYGRYIGIFNRTGMDTAQVSLLFTGNHFEGQSNKPNYPAVCRGNFQQDNNSIHFSDSCSWTANFDWSLILSGKYNISFMQGTVRIWKTNGVVTDEYLLRQPLK
jgi:hypothetical protein